MFDIVKTGLLPSSAPVNGTVKAGDYITSVQVPRDQTTGKTVEGGITEQTTRTLENLKQAITGGGATLADVYEVVIYLKHRADFAGMNAVYVQYFPENFPSRATIIAEMVDEACLIEIVARAHLGGNKGQN